MFDQIISKYGATAKAKLSSPAITGAPEDNIRAPLEELITALAEAAGQQPGWVTLVGESTLSALGTRPDYAVTVRNALTGFIELKAPGKGADPRKFTDPHDKRQWQKLKSLPNLIYSDGQSFSLWQNGALVGQIIHLSGDLDTAGAKLTAPQTLVTLLTDFLSWSPIPPDSPRKLAEVSARLCRLLRDEVLEELENGTQSLTDLATEWRGLLFPQADDAQFADGYAQAVTFGLLMARAQDIPLDKGIAHAALALRDTNTLTTTYGKPVTAPDVMAYIAALLAHPAFTARFKEDLIRPGLRVPITADAALFDRAVTLGREVIWLHTYGERFADPSAGRPAAPPRMPKGQGPTIPVGGTIPGAPNPLPDTMHHDPSTGRLHVGEGFIENVPTAVAEYQVSGRNVLRQWFSYRKADRTRPVIGDRRPPSALDKIQPDHWLPEYTEDLLNLLHVLGRLAALEPAQATLLGEICAAPLLTEAALTGAGALASAPMVKGKKVKAAAQPGLFD